MTFYLESIRQAWEFVLESGAGIGLVLILRWYWWRVNAWSEITAMVAPAVGFVLSAAVHDVAFPFTLLYLVAWTTVWWLAVTLAHAARTRRAPGCVLSARAARWPGMDAHRAARRRAPAGAIGGLAIDWIAGGS